MEGVLFYLPEQLAQSVLVDAAELAASTSRLAVDLIGTGIFLLPYTQSYLRSLEAAGSPWRFGTEEPGRFLTRCRWHPLEVTFAAHACVGVSVVSELSVVVGRSVSWCMTRSGTGTATPVTTVATIAARGLRQLARTPQVLGISVIQSVLFLLMFRYVIGGAIDVRGVSYVNFLVPGFVVSGLTFTAGGSAVAVAEDAASGLYDRLRSLPIADVAVLAGRALGDATLMIFVSLVTLLVGLAVGFRFGASAADAVAALGLVTVYAVALAWVFVWLGLVSGSAQAA